MSKIHQSNIINKIKQNYKKKKKKKNPTEKAP